MESEEQRIRERFKTHKLYLVEKTDNLKVYEFKRDDSNIYYQRWVFYKNTLYVTGDCWSSIYQFSGNVVLESFDEEWSLGYFNEKSVASKDGDSNKELIEFGDEGFEMLLNIIVEKIEGGGNYFTKLFDKYEKKNIQIEEIPIEKKIKIVLKYCKKECFDDIQDEDDLKQHLYYDNGYVLANILSDYDNEVLFGSDAWEYISWFYKINTIPKFHLYALNEANKYLDSNGFIDLTK